MPYAPPITTDVAASSRQAPVATASVVDDLQRQSGRTPRGHSPDPPSCRPDPEGPSTEIRLGASAGTIPSDLTPSNRRSHR